jgi:hypothetical protein
MPEATLLKPKRLSVLGVVLERDKPRMVSPEVARILDRRWSANCRVDWRKTGPVEEPEVEQEEAPDGRPADKQQRLAAIRAAVDKLDPDDESHFTRTGKPDARALSEILGWQVTAEERDEAMAQAADAPPEDSAEDKPSRVRIVRKPKAEADPTTEGSVEV